MFAQNGDGSEDFECQRIAAAGHDHIRLTDLVVAGSLPDANTLGATHDGNLHRQPLLQGVLACDDNIHVMRNCTGIECRQ
jgi:hypothetical protein